MSYTAEDARRDSALGAQWMDEHAHGDWVNVIDTDKLDLADGYACVWGQTSDLIAGVQQVGRRMPYGGGYFRVLDFLGMRPLARAADEYWLSEHGFTVDVSLSCSDAYALAAYEMLTCAWIEQIEQRRSDRAAAVEEAEAAVLTGDALTLSA